MRTLNLLPLWVIQKQKRRRLWIKLAAIQAAVFIGIFISMIVLERMNQAVILYSEGLADTINEYGEEPGILAGRVREARVRLGEQELLLESIGYDYFDPDLLDTFDEALPEENVIIEIEISDNCAGLSCVAAQLPSMEIHRQNLEETGLFSQIQFGGVSRLENGYFRYELTLRWDAYVK